MRTQFGEFVLDTGRQELSRRGEPVHLTPKAMQLLETLIEKRPNVVSRQELYDRLWPDVIVHEANLKNLVADLRGALDDHGRNGRFLRAVHGRGYAFCGEVAEAAQTDPDPSARIVIFFLGSHRIILRPGANIFGREEDADAVIDDPEISRHHARVVIATDRVTIEDLGSKNGTFVRGERITAPADLGDGDEVRLGKVALRVRVIRRSEETQTAD